MTRVVSVATARFDRAQFRARLAIVYGLAAGALLVPSVGPHGWLVAIFLAAVVGPAHFAIRRLAGVPNPTGWLDLLAVVSGTACAVLEPSIWQACLLFQLLTVCGAVAFLSPAWMRVLGFASVGSMAIAAALQPRPAELQMLVVAALFLPVLLAGSTRKNARRQRSGLRIAAAVDSLPMVIWEADATGEHTRSIVGRTHALLGRTVTELRERGIAADVHEDDRDAYLAGFGATTSDDREFEYRYRRPDGSVVWLRDRTTRTGEGPGAATRGVSLDVTESRRTALDVRRYEQIVQRMGAMTIVVEEGVVVQVADPIGWGLSSDAVGRPLADVLPGLDARAAAWDMLDATGALRTVELETFELPGGAIALLLTDVTERERMLALVRHQATHDDLTGLANRTQLAAATVRALERGEDVALFVIDLNDFKGVNDALGHAAGDHYLTAVGERLSRLAEPRDTIARLGGDEFAILLVGADESRIDAVVAAVVARCREPVALHGVAIASSASVGIALAPLDAGTADELLRCADLAMYTAKRGGMPSLRYTDDLEASTRRLELTGDLTRAFAEGEFEMYFQPKVDARTREWCGLEALVRWNHPQDGLLVPEAFLQLVALAGFSDELVDVALRQAIDALADLPSDIGISINLTAHDVRSPSLPQRCADALRASCVDPGRLTLEITESHMLDTGGIVQQTLNRVAALGVQIAVDDFGTGFSSLSHLRALRVDELKIDKSFVQTMTSETADLAIVRAMIDLGHNLDLTVVAEGVEDEAAAQLLLELGCDQLQGYLISRPMPVNSIPFASASATTSPGFAATALTNRSVSVAGEKLT